MSAYFFMVKEADCLLRESGSKHLVRPQKGLREDFLGTRNGCAMVAGIQKVIELMAGRQKPICRDPVGRWEDGYKHF